MPINEFGVISSTQHYYAKNTVQQSQIQVKNNFGNHLSLKNLASESQSAGGGLAKGHAISQVSYMDLFQQMKKTQRQIAASQDSAAPSGQNGAEVSEQEEMAKTDTDISEQEETAKTDTDIIVKPDGSRVLVVTTEIGGSTATMSIEISKPTDMQNECRQEGDAINTAAIDASTLK